MRTTTVRDIPDDLSEQIKQQAEIDRRSINKQMVYLLEQGAAVNDRLRASVQRGLDQSAVGEVVYLEDFTQEAEKVPPHRVRQSSDWAGPAWYCLDCRRLVPEAHAGEVAEVTALCAHRAANLTERT